MTDVWRFAQGSPAESSSETSHPCHAAPGSRCAARPGCRRCQWGQAETCWTSRAEGAMGNPPDPEAPFHCSSAERGEPSTHTVWWRGRRTCATHRGCHGDPPALCHPLTAQTAPWLQLGFSRGFLLLLIRESEAEGPWSFIIHFASEAQGDCSPSPGALSVCLVPLCPAQGKVPLPTPLCCGTAQHLREGERDQVMAT